MTDTSITITRSDPDSPAAAVQREDMTHPLAKTKTDIIESIKSIGAAIARAAADSPSAAASLASLRDALHHDSDPETSPAASAQRDRVEARLFDPVITTAQLATAHAFAHACGHRWGGLDISGVVAPLSPSKIELFVLATEDDDHEVYPAGITAPTLDGADIVHRSCGGSIAWRVRPDGSATLTLWCRAEGPYLAGALVGLVAAVADLAARGVRIEVVQDWTHRDPRIDDPGSPVHAAAEAEARELEIAQQMADGLRVKVVSRRTQLPPPLPVEEQGLD